MAIIPGPSVSLSPPPHPYASNNGEESLLLVWIGCRRRSLTDEAALGTVPYVAAAYIAKG